LLRAREPESCALRSGQPEDQGTRTELGGLKVCGPAGVTDAGLFGRVVCAGTAYYLWG